jgi:HD-like signal output (HDOD) protein
MITAPVPETADASRRQRVISAEVAARCTLPPLPPVAAQALRLIDDPDADVDALVRLVATDAALAARALRISRSLTHGPRQPPETLRRAILSVGLGTLRSVVLAASVRSVFPPRDQIAEGLWAHGLATAIAADEIARRSGDRDPGPSFIAGLLHDVGKLVFYLSDRTLFASLPHFDPVAEERAFGVTHPAIGAYLLQTWGIEEPIPHAVLEHHAPTTPIACRVAEADRIAELLGIRCTRPTEPAGSSRDAAELQPLLDVVAQRFAAERQLFD